MSLKRWRGVRWTSLLLVLALSACGPVKFSAPSSDDVDTDGTGIAPTPTPNIPLRDVHYSNQVQATDNKLDIVLIVDDSNSMKPDNLKLAAKLSSFVNKLQASNIDWQMCATVTRALPVSATDSAWGASIFWQNSATESYQLGMVLRKTSSSDLNSVFVHTMEYIDAGWKNSDDERAIKAAYHHVYNGDYNETPNNGCYRQDSAIAFIIISDEDERSIGGDASQQVYTGELKPLENEDKPQVFVDYVRQTFGADRRFTVNSIIVKPGDSACKQAQDTGSAKSHYGFKYAELSNLTGGGIGSICDSDYSTNLNLFIDKIKDSLSSIPLECTPIGAVNVTITPSIGVVESRIEGMNLIFSTPVPAGKTIDVTYQCADNRAPSSVGGKVIPLKEEGFFARIMSFFRNLF
nr:hypothetical protein BdHM001_05370 [Bdellovibrio sp. HM001]BFD65683.1 hypothetical protein HAGR004_07050 [Bdellovibrio sp. HAGR004]